jgi:hypothetical protein
MDRRKLRKLLQVAVLTEDVELCWEASKYLRLIGGVRRRDVQRWRKSLVPRKRIRAFKRKPRNFSFDFCYQESDVLISGGVDGQLKRFRFTVDEVKLIADKFGFPPWVQLYNDPVVPGYWCLAVFLYHASQHSSDLGTGDAFGLTEQQVSHFVNYCLRVIWKKQHLLRIDKHPNRERIFDRHIPAFFKAIQEKTGIMLKFCGFVDGTRVNVERPSDNLLQECIYNGWKHAHNILWQGFVTPNGMLTDLSHAFTGRHNDRYAFKVGAFYNPSPLLFFIHILIFIH